VYPWHFQNSAVEKWARTLSNENNGWYKIILISISLQLFYMAERKYQIKCQLKVGSDDWWVTMPAIKFILTECILIIKRRTAEKGEVPSFF